MEKLKSNLKLGFIGLGAVGSATYKWVEAHTSHDLVAYDPGKGLNDNFAGCDAVIIAVPVSPNGTGQDTTILSKSVTMAKAHCPGVPVFVRSTVLPGTCDSMGVIAMPEFLTERVAYDDVCRLPILVGTSDPIVKEIFPGKQIIAVTNQEAELAKFAHNCFGAVKVTYFNVIKGIADRIGADYDRVVDAASLTGFIEPTHTMVPGPDGKLGYGGRCFPENIAALQTWLHWNDMAEFGIFLGTVANLNEIIREGKSPIAWPEYPANRLDA